MQLIFTRGPHLIDRQSCSYMITVRCLSVWFCYSVLCYQVSLSVVEPVLGAAAKITSRVPIQCRGVIQN